MRKLLLLFVLMYVVGASIIYFLRISTQQPISTPTLQPIVLKYEVTDAYEWNAEKNQFVLVDVKYIGQNRTIIVSPDSKEIRILVALGKDTVLITAEVTKIDYDWEYSSYTDMFFTSDKGEPFLLELRNAPENSNLYMMYDSDTTGYQGFMGRESLKEIKDNE